MAVRSRARMPFVEAAAPGARLRHLPVPRHRRRRGPALIPAGLALGLGVSARLAARRRGQALPRLPGAARRRSGASTQDGFVPLDLDPRSGLPAYLEPFVPYFKTRRTVPFMDQLWPNADTQQAHFAAAQDLLAGRETVDGALERLDRAYARPVRRRPGRTDAVVRGAGARALRARRPLPQPGRRGRRLHRLERARRRRAASSGWTTSAACCDEDAARGALRNTLLLTVFIVCVQNVLALALALGLHRVAGRLRVVFLVPGGDQPAGDRLRVEVPARPGGPTRASTRCSALVGLGGQDWLGDPALALWSIGMTAVWQHCGLATRDLPRRAAGDPAPSCWTPPTLDGARRWRTLRHVVLPLLAPGADDQRRALDGRRAEALRPGLRDHRRRARATPPRRSRR